MVEAEKPKDMGNADDVEVGNPIIAPPEGERLIDPNAMPAAPAGAPPMMPPQPGYIPV